jgi:hypothetical protein
MFFYRNEIKNAPKFLLSLRLVFYFRFHFLLKVNFENVGETVPIRHFHKFRRIEIEQKLNSLFLNRCLKGAPHPNTFSIKFLFKAASPIVRKLRKKNHLLCKH